MYEAGSGIPVIASSGGDSFLGGGGGLGALLIGSLLASGGGLFGNRAAGADLAATAGLQNQVNQLSSQVSNLGIGSELNEIEGSINTANIANLQGIAQNALTYAQGNAALQTAVANANFTTLNSINGLGRDVQSTLNQNVLQFLNSANILNTSMLQGFNEIGRDTQNQTNQILAGQAAQNAFMCECCCSLKETIRNDGDATRALINSLNVQSLQAQLTAANAALQTNTIINSLRPTGTVVA